MIFVQSAKIYVYTQNGLLCCTLVRIIFILAFNREFRQSKVKNRKIVFLTILTSEQTPYRLKEKELKLIEGAENRLDQNEAMPKVDLLRDVSRFKSTDVVYMKRMEEENVKRVHRMQGFRKGNNRTAIVASLTAIGIYIYTMYSFKQERFLDDFEKPEKTIEKA
ncbi:PREDICTED: cytochrome c oxidase assembly factor 3, mitochondrial [Dinoponera quadriceps]|uniref:Cytochrome c oxidase assembly factor 3, mitochondrial n=1 Tax=Dinoponera quadriceps TaxID=609295 RepID=A0A6P3XHF2_DINQU|nr:PREDICTED: cytochrome c oxidase assembly factor 3, mitochondrial [Dinoponera quadriceps]